MYQDGDVSKAILGEWKLLSKEDKGTLEFKSDSTFVMVYFFEENVSDTVVVEGTYVLMGEDLLLLKVGKNLPEEYFIEEFKGDNLKIRYKKSVSNYVRNKN